MSTLLPSVPEARESNSIDGSEGKGGVSFAPGQGAKVTFASPPQWTPDAGMCVNCGGPSNEFGEEVMALCAVVVGTYSNRLPHVVPRHLVSRIIPAMTK